MAVSILSTLAFVGESSSIPTHAPGDLIIVVAARAGAGTPSAPTVGGTVPAWAYFTNAYQRVAWAVATRSDHTTGTFTSSTSGGIFVFRSTTSWSLSAVGFALQTASSSSVNFAGLTPQKTDGTSMALRVASKSVTGSAASGASMGFTDRVFVPTGASASFGSYTKAALTASDIQPGSITTWTPTGTFYSYTIEIREVNPPPAPPVNASPPVVTGVAQIGQTLTSTTGSWTGTAASYAYQWKRAGVNISGATGSTYVTQVIDAQQPITCTVTATNPDGSASATSNSITPLIPVSPISMVI